jgi:hypothetical protein
MHHFLAIQPMEAAAAAAAALLQHLCLAAASIVKLVFFATLSIFALAFSHFALAATHSHVGRSPTLCRQCFDPLGAAQTLCWLGDEAADGSYEAASGDACQSSSCHACGLLVLQSVRVTACLVAVGIRPAGGQLGFAAA